MDAGPGRSSGRSLLALLRPHRGTLTVAALLGLLGSAGGLAQPLAAREVIEALAAETSLLRPLLVLGALVVASALVSALHLWLLERTSERVVLGARRGLIAQLVGLRVPALDVQQPGDLAARATADATLLGSVASTALVQALNGALSLVGAVVLMAVVDVVLLALTAGVLVTIGAAVALVLPRIARAAERQQAAIGELGASLERVLGALRTVKASGAEARERERLEVAAQTAYERGMQTAGLQAGVGMASGLAVQVAFLVVLGVGGARVASGAMPVADLIAFLLYLFFLAEPIASLAQGATQLQSGLAAVRRIDEVRALAVEPDAAAPAGPVRPAAVPRAAPLVVFDHVVFGYRDGPRVLDGVAFAVPPRGLTAIVGPSGAGKTTLLALLERFYEPDGGTITFAGRDLRDWPRGELRAQLGLVEQDAPVLAGTLRDNLRLAAPDAGEEALRAVLDEVRLTGLLERLPDGLDTFVGSRGSTLSGGERQRIAIARALLRRPALLLLDEAASQLDAVNEQALRHVVARAARDRAVLAIAHRLSTVVDASAIVVLEAGRVRAVGTHAELLAGDALYAELATTQLTSAHADR